MELGFWIAQNLSDIRPSIRILLLLHRLKYPLSEYTQKWVSKLLLYRETLPPGERRSFDIEFCLFPSNYQQLLSKHITNSRLISTSTVEGKFLSFSSSSIWETQQNFYRSARLSAWQDVPFEISNNNLICDIYMQQIDQFLGTFPNNSKVCIVEVGAGHGILSLLLARQLSKV